MRRLEHRASVNSTTKLNCVSYLIKAQIIEEAFLVIYFRSATREHACNDLVKCTTLRLVAPYAANLKIEKETSHIIEEN